MKMISQMKKMIEADPSLDVSEWKGTFNFAAGELVSEEIRDLNAIKIEGMPERKEGEMTAVEMSVVSAANCYATTLHLEAFNEGVSLDKAQIIFSGKFSKAPFLGIRTGNSGMREPTIDLTIESSLSEEDLSKLATTALERSPVLSSLNERVILNIK